MAVYGPAPAPLAMLRGRHRFRLLVHARRSLDVQDVIRDWLGNVEWTAKVRVAVDVDPYFFPLGEGWIAPVTCLAPASERRHSLGALPRRP